MPRGRPRKNQTPDEIKSVVLAFGILEFLVKSDSPLGVTEIAADLGLEKPRVYRHLRTLSGLGYVEQDRRSEKYCLGAKLYGLAKYAEYNSNLISAARPAMLELRNQLGQSVTLSTFADDKVILLDMVRGGSSIDISIRPGATFPLHATAQGKTALAFGPATLLENLSTHGLEKLTDKTLTKRKDICKALDQIRKQGWAVAPEETMLGINALSAPIFNAGRELVGSLGILGSIHRLSSKPTKLQVKAVTAAARVVSESLGYN